MSIDFQGIADTFMTWLHQGHEAIMWISGITGLSSGIICLMLIAMGRGIARTIIGLLKIVIILAIIIFVASWYVSSGYPLPNIGIPTPDLQNLVH